MTDKSREDQYIKCARCRCKYINGDEHIKNDFGYNRLNERFKTCNKCRTYKRNKEHIKEYNAERYQQKKDEINIQHKQYRVANKERIKAHNLEQVICDVCGANVSRHSLARHKRTNKCINHNK